MAESIKGAAKLARKLARLDTKVARKITRTATRKAAKVVLAESKARVPVDTGTLRRGLKVRTMKRSRRRAGHIVTTPTRDKLGEKGQRSGYYPAVVEYGSSKQNAQPYLRPALESKRDEAIATIAEETKRGISEASGR